MLRTRSSLKPGQRGTRKLVEKYGDRLVRVRYRYDDESRLSFRTVELIEREGPIQRRAGGTDPGSQHPTRKLHESVELWIEPWERRLRGIVRGAGAVWLPERRRWRLPYGAVLGLYLEDRILDQPSTKRRARTN